MSGRKKEVEWRGKGRGESRGWKKILVGLKQCRPFPSAQPSHLQTEEIKTREGVLRPKDKLATLLRQP